MTPEERQLITGLFDRMRGFGNLEKDRDAEAVINDSVRSTPNATYMLVQSVLVQEQALQQAEGRIRELEDQVRDLEEAPPARSQSGGGSFLGGLFGGGRPASQPTGTSVPPIGSRAGSFPSGMDRQAPGSYAAPPQQPQPPASGGFMRSAMATAAGVAGGVLAASAISDLMRGGSAHASPAGNKEGAGSGTENASQQASNANAGGDNNVQQARDDQAGKGQDDRADNYEEAYDDDSSGGWDDGGGGDFDI